MQSHGQPVRASLLISQKFTLLMNPPSGSSQTWKAMAIEVKGEVKECGA